MTTAPARGAREDAGPDESLEDLLWSGDPDADRSRTDGGALRRPPARLLRGLGLSALALALGAAAAGAWPQLRAMRGAPRGVSEAVLVHTKCLGQVRVAGYGGGTAHVLLAGDAVAGDTVGSAEVLGDGGSIRVSNGGRVYFGASCTEGSAYSPSEYSSMSLLGRTLSFTVDLSGAECGCVVAMYMTPLVTSAGPGTCGSDYYCDANSVCGVKCAEMDVMEANAHAFHTTAHCKDCPNGVGKGIGGDSHDINKGQYGRGSAHGIDTLVPFQVSLQVSQDGGRVTTRLHQGDRKLELEIGTRGGLQEAFQHMAPILSYWHKPLSELSELSWFEGGVCHNGNPSRCSESVTFSSFAVDPPTDDSAPPTDPAAQDRSFPEPLAPGGNLQATPSATPRPTPIRGTGSVIMLKSGRSGYYLHVADESKSNGDPVFQRDSTSDGSKWRLKNVEGSDPMIMLQSVRSGYYLHVSDESKSNGDPVSHRDSTSDGSKWLLESVGGAVPMFMLKNVRSGYYLHIQPTSNPRGSAGPVIHTDSASDGSKWFLE